MPRRIAVALALASCAALFSAAPSQAAPGALNILVTGNCGGEQLRDAIDAQPGVATATLLDTSTSTPTAAQLAVRDLVVSTGDCAYIDQAAWGNRLADYIDAGGAVLQTAYDNWDSAQAHPTGRFASGGYPPLLIGPNDNDDVTLGTILVPNHPLLEGLGTFSSGSNTTTPLAPGATLLARWSDNRNAIAIKGRVAATSADDDSNPASTARLARNTANFFSTYRLDVTKAGVGDGTVTSSPAGIACGSDCSGLFAIGSDVTLTATADSSSEFAGWTGDECTGTTPCKPTSSGETVSVAAVFVSRARCGNPKSGTPGDDNLVGTVFNDKLVGRGGDDVLRGLECEDCLRGRAGADRLFGDEGVDRLSGGGDDDRLSGGPGDDSLAGDDGNDRLKGRSGRDRLKGRAGNDRLAGGPDRDRLSGGGGDDRLNGGSGRDRIVGGAGDDRVKAADGVKDRVRCGSGEDRVRADDEDVVAGCEHVTRA